MSVLSATSFHWLRQLRRVRRSLDTDSAATLVNAFVTFRLDYCNILQLVGSSKTVIDKLQRVMNAAAPVVSGTRKYDHGLTQLLHAELYWLNVADLVTYKLGWMVYKCLQGQARDYLSELCMPVAQVAERLRSASRNLLVAQSSSWIRMVVVPLLWLCQQLGTHCRTTCEIRTSTVPHSAVFHF